MYIDDAIAKLNYLYTQAYTMENTIAALKTSIDQLRSELYAYKSMQFTPPMSYTTSVGNAEYNMFKPQRQRPLTEEEITILRNSAKNKFGYPSPPIPPIAQPVNNKPVDIMERLQILQKMAPHLNLLPPDLRLE